MSFSPVSFYVCLYFLFCLEDESIILCCAVRSIFRVLSSVVTHVPSPNVIVGVTTAWKRCNRCPCKLDSCSLSRLHEDGGPLQH